MHFLRYSLLAILAAVALPSCQTPTPATRITQRPGLFETLPAKHKPLVQKGEVTEGMSKDAVWIAWGSPSQRSTAGSGGKTYELWRYTGLQAVYSNRMYLDTHYYRGRNGRLYGHPTMGYGLEPDYIPYTAAEVKFLNNHVAAWERIR